MKPIPTSAELLERFQRAVDGAVRPALKPGQHLNWSPFSRWNLIRVGCVRLAERVLFLVEERFRQSFLATATGDGLDAWQRSEAPGAEYARKPTTPSTTRLTLTRGSTTISGTIFAGSRFGTTPTASVAQVTFVSTADVPVASGQATVYVDVECEATGEAGNVELGTINKSLSPLFDTFNAPTNAGPAAGGGPAESDDALRARLQQRDARYRRGITQALKVGALTVPGVTRVTVYDPMNSAAPSGSAVVIVGDASGVGSQPMADAVTIALIGWASSGINFAVYPASVRSVVQAPEMPGATTQLRVEITHAKDSAFDRVAIEKRARAALAKLFAGLQYNQALYIDQLKNAVMDVDPRIRRVRFYAVPDGSEVGDLSAPSATGQRWGAADAIWLMAWAVSV